MTNQNNQNPLEEFAGATGGVLVSPLGTAFPTTPDEIPAGLNAAWVDLGLCTDAGPRFAYGVTVKKILSWQQFYATRNLITERPTKVEVDLQQLNEENIKLGLGGATVTVAGTGIKITPDDPSFFDERQLLIYANDGDRIVAQCWRRVQNTKEFAFAYSRQDITVFPLGFELLGPPAGHSDAFFWLAADVFGS